MPAISAVTLATITKALTNMGSVKPATLDRSREVVQQAAQAGYILTYVWGYDPNVGNTEHHSGLAADFMVFSNKVAGDWIYKYLWDNRVRLRVRHIIWQQSITSTVVSPGVRRAMENRGNTTANHRDHVHVFYLDAKAYVKPGVPVAKIVVKKVAAKPAALPMLRVGSKGANVSALQRGLNKLSFVADIKIDGNFGPATENAVRQFQHHNGFSIAHTDGIVGPATRVWLRKYGIVV